MKLPLDENLSGLTPFIRAEDGVRTCKATRVRSIWPIRFIGSLAALFTGTLVLILPFAVSLLNGIPDISDLHTISVRILRVNPTEPHLWVQLPNGRQQGMEWPVPIKGGKGGMRASVLSDKENQRVLGCQATVRGMNLKWTISERFRVWELSCPDNNMRIDFETSKRNFDIWRSGELITGPVMIVIFIFFNYFVFVLERKGKNEPGIVD